MVAAPYMGGLGSLLHGMMNFLPGKLAGKLAGKLVESADISRRHLFGDRAAAPASGPGRGG